jgi:hypothetical protein
MSNINRWDLIEFLIPGDVRARRGIVVGRYRSTGSLQVAVRGEANTLYINREDVIKTVSDSLIGKYIGNQLDGGFPERVFLKKRKRFWEVWK